MSGEIEYSGGGLTKRHTRGGWRWCGQVRWRRAGDKRWGTRMKALEAPDGSPIMTDADEVAPDGSRVRTTRGIRAAQAAYDRWRAELDGHEYDAGSTVADYVRADVEARRGVLAGSTVRACLEYVPIIERGLEGVTMAALDAKAVRLWVRGMVARGLAPATVRKAYNILAQVCDRAVENGDMAANPCTAQIRRAELPRAAGGGPNALDAQGVRAVNGLLDAEGNPRLRVGARLALACGLRQGEACGLRWRDVDAGAGVIHVRESIANVGGGTEAKEPKSAAGRRDVPMPAPVAAELAEWRAAQLDAWRVLWARGGAADPEAVPFADCRVIGYADGSHITPHALGTLWRALAVREGVTGTRGRRVTFHDLRHTYATMAVESGADVRSVAAIMGHADVAMTLNVYADSTQEARRRAQEAASMALTAGTRYAQGEEALPDAEGDGSQGAPMA